MEGCKEDQFAGQLAMQITIILILFLITPHQTFSIPMSVRLDAIAQHACFDRQTSVQFDAAPYLVAVEAVEEHVSTAAVRNNNDNPLCCMARWLLDVSHTVDDRRPEVDVKY